MSIVRALTLTGDWTYGAGLNNYLSNQSALAQQIGCRLISFLGDCFFDLGAGIDWFNLLGGKNTVALELAIRTTILNTPNVTGLVNVSLNLVDVSRTFSVSYTITSSFGKITSSVNQSLGNGNVSAVVFQQGTFLNLDVGLLPPPAPANNVLQQTNFPLLNNVGATAITGAIFNSSVYWEVDLEYFIAIRTSTQGFLQRGKLVVKYDKSTGLWSCDDVNFAGSSGPVTGVMFTCNASTGQVYYSSDNVTGSGYVGNLIVQSVVTFNAGA
jgi:hypothetical protein